MSTILNFPPIERQHQTQDKLKVTAVQTPPKLKTLPDEHTFLLIQNALDEACHTHNWRATREKIDCAIRRANLTVIHSKN